MKEIYYSKFDNWMEAKGVDIYDIADLLDIAPITVRHKLNRKSDNSKKRMPDFTLDEVRIICEEYGLSAEEYFVNVNRKSKNVTKQIWTEFTLEEIKTICEEHIRRKEKEHHGSG